MLPLSASRRRSVAVIIAVALGASACGSGEASTAPTLATAPSADASGVNGSDGETAAPPAEAAEPAGDPAVAGPVENLFPDIDVVNVADGSTLNLAAELGGADRPTLLWFWAPH